MKHIDREYAKRQVGAGWHKLLDEAYDYFEKDSEILVSTVKEKFGGLRIYVEGANDSKHINNLIDRLEQQSFYVCEECGAPGLLRNKRWMKTLCDKHCDGSPPLLHKTWWESAEQLDLFGRENNVY